MIQGKCVTNYKYIQVLTNSCILGEKCYNAESRNEREDYIL